MTDLFLKFLQFIHDLLDFKTGQLTEAVSHDSGCLRIVEVELLHDGLLGLG